MRVVIADPPSFTPPYDHELAAALVRAGVDVELLTSRFRFGSRPTPDGYRLDDSLYAHSSAIETTALRLSVKAIEHPLAMRRVLSRPTDVLHLQWLTIPEVDRLLLRRRASAPVVFTAHDLLPRRTARHTGLWRTLFGRFDRIVVHSHRGRTMLEEFGVPGTKLRVIPHPVFRSDPPRADDVRTVLAPGVIRGYKGLPDAVDAVLRIPDARLVVAGDPRVSLDELRRAGGSRVDWRLGYLDAAALEEALSEATVAVFPYRAELDQSGALLQALGAGVPAVVYDVGGLGEVVGRFGAGRVVPPGDLTGLSAAIRELLDDPDALQGARVGAERARSVLTWDASAAAHLELYGELL